MPAPYTHHTFANDVFNSLNDNIKKKIEPSKNVYLLFGQSFDLLHYAKLERKDLASYCHTHNVNLYFKNIITYIRNNKLKNNSDVLSYLYGSICHYVLDSTCHPFICYHSGVYNSKRKETFKYRGKHAYIEFMIDALIYYERNNKYIYKYNIGKIAPKFKFKEELINVIDYAFLNTFNLHNMGKNVNKAYNHSNFIYKYGMSDRTGIKRLLYKIIDRTVLLRGIYLENYCYHIKKLDYDVLNLEKEKWVHPTDDKLTYNYSFNDLYDIAIKKASKYITHINNAIDKSDKEIEKVLKEIGNVKYTTGFNNNKYMQYFKY